MMAVILTAEGVATNYSFSLVYVVIPVILYLFFELSRAKLAGFNQFRALWD